jgi:unsaturated rhamnogalacturonyl hydrolase
MRKNTKDEKTGLYFHGWDESGQTPWHVPGKNTAPEIWGRSLGWYGLAVVDIIGMLPNDHPKKKELIGVIQELIENLVRYQDEKTGLWYQVIDKGHLEDNWLESSCSSLFVYTIAKAVNQGYIDAKYFEYAKKGFEGIVNHCIEVDDKDQVTLTGICIGTSIGVYDYYVGRQTSENDLHGVGAFILASMQMYHNESK